jgi:hypothetical protein
MLRLAFEGESLMKAFLDLCVQPGGFWLPVFILSLMFFLTLVGIVAIVQWRELRQSELQAALTQTMLQRGMPAAEILQTLAAYRNDKPNPSPQERARLAERALA